MGAAFYRAGRACLTPARDQPVDPQDHHEAEQQQADETGEPGRGPGRPGSSAQLRTPQVAELLGSHWASRSRIRCGRTANEEDGGRHALRGSEGRCSNEAGRPLANEPRRGEVAGVIFGFDKVEGTIQCSVPVLAAGPQLG